MSSTPKGATPDLPWEHSELDARAPIKATKHPIYGIVPAPTRADQITRLVTMLSRIGIGAWRGQPDATYRIDSTLIRRWRLSITHTAHTPERVPDETLVRELENALLERARRAGHRSDTGDLELLARLRHHGAATRLLDATRNAFVALWFACRQKVNEPGLLVGFRLGDPNDALEVTSEMLIWSVDAVLAEADGRLLWWQPHDLSPRIASQHGILVLGDTQSLSWGSLKFGTEPLLPPNGLPVGDIDGAATVLVTPQLKRAMNSIWRPVFGFSDEVLFPDFDGFAHAHRDTAELPPDFPKAHRRDRGETPPER